MLQLWAGSSTDGVLALIGCGFLKRDLLKQLKHVETRKQDGLKHVETICRECSLCRLHILQVGVVILVI